jgi:hypothetical protein
MAYFMEMNGAPYFIRSYRNKTRGTQNIANLHPLHPIGANSPTTSLDALEVDVLVAD